MIVRRGGAHAAQANRGAHFANNGRVSRRGVLSGLLSVLGSRGVRIGGLGVRLSSLLLGVAAIAMVTVGGTYAYNQSVTVPVVNSFQVAGGPSISILEDFTPGGTVKSNVKVRNTGDMTAFVRCSVSFTLRDENGNTVAKVPVSGTDYTVGFNTTDWAQGSDGFWYCLQPVRSGSTSAVLMNSCTTTNSSYHLCVDIVAQAVQATPFSAVNGAWPGNPLALS